ncbi:MAG: hypothetical protein LQ345_004821 [Seirophora villosa]|nr:MAG: hypothetical protein LQ345_004821 [Seirophora villosa]
MIQHLQWSLDDRTKAIKAVKSITVAARVRPSELPLRHASNTIIAANVKGWDPMVPAYGPSYTFLLFRLIKEANTPRKQRNAKMHREKDVRKTKKASAMEAGRTKKEIGSLKKQVEALRSETKEKETETLKSEIEAFKQRYFEMDIDTHMSDWTKADSGGEADDVD